MNNTSEHNTSPYKNTRERNLVFFFVAVGIVSLTYGFFYAIDFLPEHANTNTQTVINTNTSTNTGTDITDPLPITIIFDALDEKEVTVLNPQSSSVDVLDKALLEGVIRHPDSADFANKGTIFLLGHSSYLPVVKNKNFQAFNDIQKLKWGDTIRLRSTDTEYIYSVERVYQAKATDAEIEIEYDTPTLVLATCNSFATKDDRYVVEASFVSSRHISEN